MLLANSAGAGRHTAVVCFTIAVVGLARFGSHRQQEGELDVQKLTIVNADGEVTAELKGGKHGAVLQFYSLSGSKQKEKSQLVLGTPLGRAMLELRSFRDSDRLLQVSLEGDPESPQISLENGGGEASIILDADGTLSWRLQDAKDGILEDRGR